ncbi:MAG: hypothetical protein JJT76_06465 [Clostridiaceae bacterium]|nr:hypothetical protein [Clostridiaceae bacterium]
MMHINLTLPLEDILQEFFNKELQGLIKKYKNISCETTEKLKQLLCNLPKENYVQRLKLEEVIELLEEDHYVIALYLWMREHGEPVTIEEARGYFEEIELKGYVETEDYLLTVKGQDIDEYMRDILLELVEETYYVEKFFDKEQLANMWLDGISREDAVAELMSITDPHVEFLGLEFEDICNYNNGDMLMAAYKDF